MTAMLADHWATAHPEHELVHRIEEARQVANRKRDRRETRRAVTAESSAAPVNPS